MNTAEVTAETIKKARMLGYSAVMRGSLPSSKNPTIKAAADADLNAAAKSHVDAYGDRLDKQAKRREMVYNGIVAPIEEPAGATA